MSQHIYRDINLLGSRGSQIGPGAAAEDPKAFVLGSLTHSPQCTIQISACSTCAMKVQKTQEVLPQSTSSKENLENLDAGTLNNPQSVTSIYNETHCGLAARRNSWNWAQCYSCFLNIAIRMKPKQTNSREGEEILSPPTLLYPHHTGTMAHTAPFTVNHNCPGKQ